MYDTYRNRVFLFEYGLCLYEDREQAGKSPRSQAVGLLPLRISIVASEVALKLLKVVVYPEKGKTLFNGCAELLLSSPLTLFSLITLQKRIFHQHSTDFNLSSHICGW